MVEIDVIQKYLSLGALDVALGAAFWTVEPERPGLWPSFTQPKTGINVSTTKQIYT